MVARVVRIDGKLVLELDEPGAREFSELEGRTIEVRREGQEAVVDSADFDRVARDILKRHASTFEKLSK